MVTENTTFFGFVGARKGSKGLPGKNKLTINGIPLFLIALNKLREVGVQNIIFSSDCIDMLSIAKEHGYQTSERPEKFADDKSRIPEEILRLAKEFKINEKFVISVPPTAPLLRVASLRSAIEKIQNSSEADSCIALIDWTATFPGLAFYKDENDALLNIGNKLGIETYPRQKRIKFKQNTGSFYIRNLHKMKTQKLSSADNWLGKKILYQEITKSEAINIDTIDDWDELQEKIK